MSELDDLVLEAIETHLPPLNITATLGANGLRIPLLSVVIRVRDAEEVPRKTSGVAVSAIVQLGALDSISGGMQVLHTGMGATLEEAVANAAHQWIAGVLPVVYSWLKRSDHPDVGRSQMVVAIEDTGEKFGWTVHLGPVITRAYGKLAQPPDPPRNEIYLKLFNVLHPFAAHSTLFWLECFAARYPDGRVDATCRKHNDDWLEGQQALLLWAHEWPDNPDGFVTRRQFIILEPTPVDKLPSGKDLVEKLPLGKKETKPWWRKLLAR